MNRSDLRILIAAAFSVGRADYARALCQVWLNRAPGDLGVRFELARAYAAEKNTDDALKTLLAVTSVDLENSAAYQFLTTLAPKQPAGVRAAACANVLDGHPLPRGLEAPLWMAPARRAVTALAGGHFDTAREQIDIAMRDDPTLPLLSLILLKTHWQAHEPDLTLPLAKGFHDRWPNVVAFGLCLVEGLFRTGAAHPAVEILHSISSLDAGSEVVDRYWGQAHPYRDLWPHLPQISVPGPIPAEVISVLGLNRIQAAPPAAAPPTDVLEAAPQPGSAKSPSPADNGRLQPASATVAKTRIDADRDRSPDRFGPQVSNDVEQLPEPARPPLYPKTPRSVSEELADIESTLTAIGAQIGSARANRKPAHVILFSPKLLAAKFGQQGAEQVLKLVGELGRVTAKRRRVTVLLHAPEAPAAEQQLNPVDPARAWDVKMQLHDLDARLAAHNQAIQSLLIIGGDDLLPFHRLPNPTDDIDEDIPSDNPYGTLDDNYFIPEWPVGRLPSPCGRDPEPLCRLLTNTIAAHQAGTSSVGWLPAFLIRFFQRRPAEASLPSLGYSASIWKEAAREVYAAIGKASDLQTCPPVDSDSAPSLAKSQLTYFNLHGVEDGPNWYGQRTEADGYGPLYPVALTPQATAGSALPKVVYTEACYGANILDKAEPDAALCLRLLTDGVWAFVGSTRIAYGSVAVPLIGADLLGRLFWEALLSGLPVGESVRFAKLNLAHAMHKRQNFLDGEDQKTLISFQLYGDPLLPIVAAAPGRDRLRGRKALPVVKTVAMEYAAGDEADIQPEAVAEIKAMLAHYLPGSETARVGLLRPLSPIRAKSKAAPTHRVYTFAKEIRTSTAQTFPAYARVTVNKAGKVVKLTVSR